MNIKDVEKKFLSILDRLNKIENGEKNRSFGYQQIKNNIVNKSSMLQYFDYHINIVNNVKDSIEGKTIVDAGCGSGAFSVLLSLLGAQKIYAIDFIEDCVKMTKYMIDIANIKNIEVIHCDIAEVKFPEKSIDGMFSIEGISHYRDQKSFLKMTSKALKEGGFLVILDGNNAASPQIRRKTFKIWDIYENYPDTINIYGHSKNQTSYLNMRKEIIKNKFSLLSHEEIEKFASYTFSYSKEKIVKAVEQYIKGDFSLKSEYSYGKCPLDPIKDIYMEYLFNPKDLKRELRDYGFKSKIKSIGPAKRKFKILHFFWELFSPLTIFLPRGFQIIATKNSTTDHFI